MVNTARVHCEGGRLDRARLFLYRAGALLLVILLTSPQGRGYSVLTHEQVVDLLWTEQMAPMILARFPGTTPDGLKQAHSYAYGGCVLQDMGYYPHGSHYFSDLLHYVRTGDFVVNLLKDATDANEYAFALGALAHYAGDTTGHPVVNQVTAMQYPKLAAKYGPAVTYDEDPTAHVRVEFGFDVAEVAKGNFQEDDYRQFIGFHVSHQLLERAFRDTYGFEVKDVLPDEQGNINSFRNDVSKLIPEMTRVAWASYGKDIQKAQPDATEKKFRYRMSKVEYEKNFGKGYQKPTFGERFVAVIVRILPKIGPLKALAVKMPNAQEQDMYVKSVNATVDDFRRLLQQVAAAEPTLNTLTLPQMDFDTGKPTQRGEYMLSDETYAKLLLEVTKPQAPPIPVDLRDNLLAYYAEPNVHGYLETKQPEVWAHVQANLALLKQAQPAAVKVSDSPTILQTPSQPLPTAGQAAQSPQAVTPTGPAAPDTPPAVQKGSPANP